MTLSFSWATNTNYSTGPDAGTPTKVDPASAGNGFVRAVIAAPQHVNYLFDLVGDALAKAIDGADGGSYTLANPLTIGGDELRIGQLLRILTGAELVVDDGGLVRLAGDMVVEDDADVTFEADSDLNVEAGARLNLSGTMSVASGGAISLSGSGADMNVASGGGINVATGGEVAFASAQDLKISSQAFTFRIVGGPVFISETTPGVPDWRAAPGGAPGVVQHDLGGAAVAYYALPLRPGDVLNGLLVQIEGGAGAGHSSLPDTLPLVEIIPVDTDGVAGSPLALASDTSLNAAAYDAPHPVSLSGGSLPLTVGAAAALYLRVTGETDANSVAGTTRICAIVGTGVRNSFLGTGAIEMYA